MQNLKRLFMDLFRIGRVNSLEKSKSNLAEYEYYFQPKDASSSIERAVVAMHARGNPSLSKGLYVSEEEYEKKIEFVINCDLSPIQSGA